MILANLVLGSILMFQSGMFWTAYKIETIEDKPKAVHKLWWSISLCLFGLYFLISMIGAVE